MSNRFDTSDGIDTSQPVEDWDGDEWIAAIANAALGVFMLVVVIMVFIT